MRYCLSAFAKIAALVLAVSLFPAPPGAEARACRVNLIPNGARLSCGACHVSQLGGGPRNAFGAAVGTLVGLGTCEQFWGPQLAQMDSDGDGVSNGAELQDPDGAWQPGMSPPGNLSLVTNPGVPEAPPIPPFIRGDANSDGVMDISDALFVLDAFFHRDGPLSCMAAADANKDGRVDVSDAIYILSYQFTGGRSPPAPFPLCATVRGGLNCESHEACN